LPRLLDEEEIAHLAAARMEIHQFWDLSPLAEEKPPSIQQQAMLVPLEV
jgi:hypothetical protein